MHPGYHQGMNWRFSFVLLVPLLLGARHTLAPDPESQVRVFVQDVGLPVPEMKHSTLGPGLLLLKARNDKESLTLGRKLAKSGLNLKKVLVLNPIFQPRSGKSSPGVTVKLHLPSTAQQGDRVPYTFQITNHTGEMVKGHHGRCHPDLQLLDPSSGWVIDDTSHNRPCPMSLEYREIKAGETLKLEGMWMVQFANGRFLPTGTYRVRAGIGLSPPMKGQKGWVLPSQRVDVLVKGKP